MKQTEVGKQKEERKQDRPVTFWLDSTAQKAVCWLALSWMPHCILHVLGRINLFAFARFPMSSYVINLDTWLINCKGRAPAAMSSTHWPPLYRWVVMSLGLFKQVNLSRTTYTKWGKYYDAFGKTKKCAFKFFVSQSLRGLHWSHFCVFTGQDAAKIPFSAHTGDSLCQRKGKFNKAKVNQKENVNFLI